MAERSSLAAAALARRRACGTRDHVRRHRNGRDDSPHRQGARRGPDCRAALVPDRRARRCRRLSIAKSAELAVELLDAVLPEPEFTPQDEEGATYAEKITAADRELDWSRPPDELLNRIRALSPHIGARAELDGRPVTIWKARIAGARLEPLEVQPDGKRRMTYDEFQRGLR